MAKIYTKGTWVDEVLAGSPLYNINDSGSPIHEDVEIELSTGVSVAGTGVTAARMNNIEDGIDGLDTKIESAAYLGFVFDYVENLDAVTTLSGSDLIPVNIGGSGKSISKTNLQTSIGGGGLPAGHLFGMQFSNNTGSPITCFDVSAGKCRDSTDANDISTGGSSFTKNLTLSWAVGSGTNKGCLDTGSVADGTYHVFAIKRSDTGIVDILASTSESAPTMPASYDQKRRIFSVLRSSGSIVGIVQDGDKFSLKTPVGDVAAAANFGTSGSTVSLSVPNGIRVEAFGDHAINNSGVDNTGAVITDLSCTDIDPSSSYNTTVFASTGAIIGHAPWKAMTNTSRQVRIRMNRSAVNIYFYVSTYGWIDTRGRLT